MKPGTRVRVVSYPDGWTTTPYEKGVVGKQGTVVKDGTFHTVSIDNYPFRSASNPNIDPSWFLREEELETI